MGKGNRPKEPFHIRIAMGGSAEKIAEVLRKIADGMDGGNHERDNKNNKRLDRKDD